MKAGTGFKFMCVLTILGNIFLILVNLLKVGLLDTGMRNDGIGAEAYFYLSLMLQLVLLTCLGAIIGAALMFAGKRLGFTIYAVSMALHILLVICAMLLWAMTIFLIGVSSLLLFYCIIPVSFFLYFRKNMKYLA